MAAAVAEATVGLVKEVHMPNGAMFTIGLKSIMLAMGLPASMTRFSGVTVSWLGAMPKVHWSMAEVVTYESTMVLIHFYDAALDIDGGIGVESHFLLCLHMMC